MQQLGRKQYVTFHLPTLARSGPFQLAKPGLRNWAFTGLRRRPPHTILLCAFIIVTGLHAAATFFLNTVKAYFSFSHSTAWNAGVLPVGRFANISNLRVACLAEDVCSLYEFIALCCSTTPGTHEMGNQEGERKEDFLLPSQGM